MKREIPILLTVLCGLAITLSFFAPSPDSGAVPPIAPTFWQAVNAELLEWAKILFAVAFLLGITNLFRINLKQIAAGHSDRAYKIVLLVSMFAFLVVGLAEMHERDLPNWIVRNLVPADHVFMKDGSVVAGWVQGATQTGIRMRDGDGQDLPDIPHEQVELVSEPSAKMWVYFKIFAPLQATMFSLLAFYVASATFRAFRARSLESTLLLVAGAVVMLGQVQLGETLTGSGAATAQKFLMDNVVKAAERAIVIGASLGVLATGLRIVLGLERSYLSD